MLIPDLVKGLYRVSGVEVAAILFLNLSNNNTNGGYFQYVNIDWGQ